MRADLELARDSFANTPPSLNALLKPAQQPNWTTTKAEILEGFGHTLTASQATRLDAIADDFFADVPKPFLMLIDRLTDDHRHIFATSTRVIGESLLTTRFGELNEPSQPARFALGTARRHLLAVVEELRKEVAEDHRHVFEVALSAADKLIVLSRRVLRRARSLSGAALENPVLAAHWGEVFYECVQMTIAAYLVAWASVTRLEGGAPNALWARIRRRAREMSTSVDGRPATLVRGASLADYPDGSHVRVGGLVAGLSTTAHSVHTGAKEHSISLALEDGQTVSVSLGALNPSLFGIKVGESGLIVEGTYTASNVQVVFRHVGQRGKSWLEDLLFLSSGVFASVPFRASLWPSLTLGSDGSAASLLQGAWYS